MRRYTALRSGPGTVIPLGVRREVMARDEGRCVCDRAGFPAAVVAACPRVPVELDHVRASHGMGMKSETTVANLVALSNPCHLWKTENGRLARPKLLAYIASTEPERSHAHVDPMHGCPLCMARTTA